MLPETLPLLFFCGGGFRPSPHDGISKPFFEALLALFAREAGAGAGRIVILVLDNAGWHSEAGLNIPAGLRLVFLPPFTPKLQPAETLWTLVDEPLVNQHIPATVDLENIIAKRCVGLAAGRRAIKAKTGFRWWPKIVRPN